MSCSIYIVRHGETEWNQARILQGHGDSPLTERGINEAKSVIAQFHDIEFAAAYASDSLRAKRTAEIILSEHRVAVKTSQALRERYYGKFDGQKLDLFLTELKNEIAHMESLKDDELFRYKLTPEIESDEEIVGRFITFLREVAIAYEGQNILIVSHGQMIRALLVHLGFGTYAELDYSAVKNAAWLKIDSDGIEFKISQTHDINKRQV